MPLTASVTDTLLDSSHGSLRTLRLRMHRNQKEIRTHIGTVVATLPLMTEAKMRDQPYPRRLAKCSALMQEAGLDMLLLTKPANMFYLTGDGRLCAPRRPPN